jgi:hypothetical protein
MHRTPVRDLTSFDFVGLRRPGNIENIMPLSAERAGMFESLLSGLETPRGGFPSVLTIDVLHTPH